MAEESSLVVSNIELIEARNLGSGTSSERKHKEHYVAVILKGLCILNVYARSAFIVRIYCRL